MAGLGIPTGCRRRVRTTPVERCVDVMRHGGEGALPPPDDALVDLEPPPHDTLDAPSGRQLEAVPNQRLPDRRHPADRQVSRPAIDRVAPRVTELGEDDVGGRSRPSHVHDDLTVEQEPAWCRRRAGRRRAGELEWEPAVHAPPDRQSLDGVAVAGMEPGCELVGGGVPMAPQVHRRREIGRPWRRHRRGTAVRLLGPATPLQPSRDTVR